jgi:DNA-binding transcriptional LysR family regulator
MRAKGLLHSLDVAMEVGGWGTILGYVRAGLGVGLVSARAVEGDNKGLVVRGLDAKAFPPLQQRLIARRKAGAPDQPDLSPPAQALHDLLVEEGKKG